MSSATLHLHRIFLFFATFAVGFISGLRSMTGLAVTAWGAHLGWLDLHSTAISFLERPWFIYASTAFALGELIADKFPGIPNRISPAPLAFRFLTGGLCGAAIFMSAHQSAILGVAVGVLGAMAGAFEGYHLRQKLTKQKSCPDFAVALAEDVIAVGGALLLVSHLY